MAELMAWPLNLAEYEYNAEDIQRWMAGKTSGVYGAEGNWQVVAKSGMQITVKAAGQIGGWLSNMGIHGIVFWNSTDIDLTVPTADGVNPRIDRVVVSWHIPQQASVPTVEVRKGTPASSPVGPALANDGEYAEICLAEIHLSAGQTEISSQHIIDTRLDESLCGIVSMGIEKYPTDGLEAEFRDWLDNLKTNLDENTAANLLNNIETHKADTTVHMRQLGYSKSGTTHALTGLTGVTGTVSCVFTATAAFSAGDTFTVDGTPYTIQLSNGETAEDNLFVSGAAVSIIVDTGAKKVNFKSGGGLSASKLALATAAAADVLSGKTFYAGDKEIKTGSLQKGPTRVSGSVTVDTDYTTMKKTVTLSGTIQTLVGTYAWWDQSPMYYCFFDKQLNITNDPHGYEYPKLTVSGNTFTVDNSSGDSDYTLRYIAYCD